MSVYRKKHSEGRGCDSFIHPKFARKRQIDLNRWAAFRGHLSVEWDSLPPDSPRRRPTLPRLRFLEKEVA